MAKGRVSSPEMLDAHLDNLAAVESQQPLHRPGKGQFGLAPAHGLGKGNAADQLLQEGRQQFSGSLALDFLCSHHVFAFGSADNLQVLHSHAFGAGKTKGRLGRLPVSSKGGLLGRANMFLQAGRLFFLHIIDCQSQAARGACAAHPAKTQAEFPEFVLNSLL